MTQVVRDAREMVAGMMPELKPGQYVFCATGDRDWAALQPLAMFREAEGVSLILEREAAQASGLTVEAPMALITLNVYSALDGVGLTAAVATALAQAGIACNMVAALNHDHVFVPAERADEAVRILRDLQVAASAP
ncbi:ACT domain-containing protein [Caulobacter sp.]|uniref:ACT domain-containing protein n=1 Tax=Caulobacter sp. TaxID=78 RepID=UPI001B24AB10|nr:ACT domain-containing protein [Caulobacter sp.]MBO9546857.1 ACT domain-containing protein [Caulobacter sp.]